MSKQFLDMKFENAYHDVKIVKDSIVDGESFQKADAGLVLSNLDRICEALEKQIPMKPKNMSSPDVYGDYYGECPLCNTLVVTQFGMPHKYCSKCGQKLDWSEKE